MLATVGDRHRAEDLVAEAFARAWASWPRVGRHPAPEAWLMRCALNTHISWWRRRRREVAWTDGLDLPGPVEGSADLLLDRAVWVALGSLAPRQRQVIALRVFLDLDTQTVAETLGIAAGTVQVHLHRATSALRAELSSMTE